MSVCLKHLCPWFYWWSKSYEAAWVLFFSSSCVAECSRILGLRDKLYFFMRPIRVSSFLCARSVLLIKSISKSVLSISPISLSGFAFCLFFVTSRDWGYCCKFMLSQKLISKLNLLFSTIFPIFRTRRGFSGRLRDLIFLPKTKPVLPLMFWDLGADYYVKNLLFF